MKKIIKKIMLSVWGIALIVIPQTSFYNQIYESKKTPIIQEKRVIDEGYYNHIEKSNKIRTDLEKTDPDLIKYVDAIYIEEWNEIDRNYTYGKEIHLLTTRYDKYTIEHELLHVIDNHFQISKETDFEDTLKADGVEYTNIRNGVEEEWVNTYTWYLHQPKLLKRLRPNGYLFVKKIDKQIRNGKV